MAKTEVWNKAQSLVLFPWCLILWDCGKDYRRLFTVIFKKKEIPLGIDENTDEEIDDFKGLVDSLWLKIVIGILFFYSITIHNILTIIYLQVFDVWNETHSSYLYQQG